MTFFHRQTDKTDSSTWALESTFRATDSSGNLPREYPWQISRSGNLPREYPCQIRGFWHAKKIIPDRTLRWLDQPQNGLQFGRELWGRLGGPLQKTNFKTVNAIFQEGKRYKSQVVKWKKLLIWIPGCPPDMKSGFMENRDQSFHTFARKRVKSTKKWCF